MLYHIQPVLMIADEKQEAPRRINMSVYFLPLPPTKQNPSWPIACRKKTFVMHRLPPVQRTKLKQLIGKHIKMSRISSLKWSVSCRACFCPPDQNKLPKTVLYQDRTKSALNRIRSDQIVRLSDLNHDPSLARLSGYVQLHHTGWAF